MTCSESSEPRAFTEPGTLMGIVAPARARWRPEDRRRASRLIGLVLTLGAATGCSGTTGHLALASTRTVRADDLDSDRPPEHVIGHSCIEVYFIFPTAFPNFGDAVEDALRKGGGQVLTDVTIGYTVVDLPFIYGIACYVAEGDAR